MVSGRTGGQLRRGLLAVTVALAAALAAAPLASALGLSAARPQGHGAPLAPATTKADASSSTSSTSPPTTADPSSTTTSTTTVSSTTQPSVPPATDPSWSPPPPDVACVSLKVTNLGVCVPGSSDGASAARPLGVSV